VNLNFFRDSKLRINSVVGLARDATVVELQWRHLRADGRCAATGGPCQWIRHWPTEEVDFLHATSLASSCRPIIAFDSFCDTRHNPYRRDKCIQYDHGVLLFTPAHASAHPAATPDPHTSICARLYPIAHLLFDPNDI